MFLSITIHKLLNLMSTRAYFFLFVLLICCNFSHSQSTRNKPANNYSKDTTYIRSILTKITTLYYDAQHDSVLIYLDKISSFSKKNKIDVFNPEIYFQYGQYYRGHTQYNWNKALEMFNKSLYWAEKRKDNLFIEEINYKKLTVYSDIFLGSSTSEASQGNLVKQLYENIRFSEISKSKKSLYKTIYLFKDIYYTYKQDSSYYSFFDKHLKSNPLPPTSINYQIIYFGYFIYKKDIENAKKCFENLTRFHANKELSDMVYAYYISDMMRESLSYPSLNSQIASQLKPRLYLLPGRTDSLTYYNNFATYYIKRKQFNEANYCNLLAKNILLKHPTLSITHRYDFLINQLSVLEQKNELKKSVDVYKNLIPIKDSLNRLFAGFNLILLQEQVASDLKLKEFQKEIELKKYESEQFQAQKLKEFSGLILSIVILFISLIVIGIQIRKNRKQTNTLLQLTSTQNTLFGVIGHDLRSPVLAAYTNIKRVINNPELTAEEIRNSLHSKMVRLNTLLLTLDNLLYWSNSQQKSFKRKPVQCNLLEIVEECLELLETNIELNELSIVNEVDPTLECIMDENHFKIIIRNLLQNAIKFSPNGTSITITSGTQPPFITLSILDSGPGFGNTANSKQKGSGLGLTLVQSLLEINNGEFETTDTACGALVTVNVLNANI
ncbi:signal transduction histidine kinase [Runella defluvii]|uniref:histidine kinase n=1 Tax=Runella defluvii TaxID=370973 RepID=A0A7W6ERX6_9BACT|nr:HAMP domain-containing sensor histidine kinase [Runella defluvii]MBB3840135.1 signal transduction histidine kinase [Runella defluvii]